ncbi:sugar transferase [Microbacterium rhizosphaerae]|uniref:Sugar transferase n=1 Tax=Microbacterium rhizosphaerae TaxID=1678237 RepID=A0ABZ0SQ36_9MICO|nr:sugar transferase [Microbacterium rhizosphaerae]WPR90570.1 sugar transferase [Microbacterium rhizosphaerae]
MALSEQIVGLTRSSAARSQADAVRSPRAAWEQRLSRLLWASDLVILIVVTFGTQLAWFGFADSAVVTRATTLISGLPYWMFSTILVMAWMWCLSLTDSRRARVVGVGSLEYVRIVTASFRLFGTIAILAFIFRVDVARGYLLIALPVGVGLLAGSRWAWRRWLVRRRVRGEYTAQALLVGSTASVRHIARELAASPEAGYRVVGVCVDDRAAGSTIGDDCDVRVLGDFGSVERVLADTGADTVIVTSGHDLPPERVKRLSWGLETGRQSLVLAPSIMDIAGPRLHTRPVAGLPLIHVETPRFTQGQRIAKRSFDLIVSFVLLVLLSPVLLALALAVRFSSNGPALFSQVRIGHNGRPFRMFKFRSMVVDAEDRLPALIARQNAGNEVLFKLADDPRVTPLGRFMRRYSLDELPQLFNVFIGDMALVGPRPPLPSEVSKYADHVHRRFMVKPGITGAWQVGGRSTLTWQDSVRLDLSYVENWSLAGDFVILLKTFRAVFAPGSTAV